MLLFKMSHFSTRVKFRSTNARTSVSSFLDKLQKMTPQLLENSLSLNQSYDSSAVTHTLTVLSREYLLQQTFVKGIETPKNCESKG